MAGKRKTPAKPKTASKGAAMPTGGAKPKFGSPAWDAKYGIKRFTKKSAKGK
jgi:hypothetical protein